MAMSSLLYVDLLAGELFAACPHEEKYGIHRARKTRLRRRKGEKPIRLIKKLRFELQPFSLHTFMPSPMESYQISSISWPFNLQDKTMDELKCSLWRTTMELEATRLAALEEIQRKEEEIKQLKELLNRAINEREETTQKYGSLIRQQRQAPAPEDDRKSVESIVCESPVSCIMAIGPLPEKGKLLQAVMKAGPLLQAQLLAGPLPQWRHATPPLTAIEIPPVTMQAVDRTEHCRPERSLISSDDMEEDSYIVYTSKEFKNRRQF